GFLRISENRVYVYSMGDMATGSSPPQKRRRWGRVVGFILGGLLLLLVIFYFVASSDFFVQKVVLPRVSKALNARVTVSDSSVSPFSHVVLRGLKVQTTGNEPLATVQEARVHYSLGAILGGHIKVSEIAVVSPVLQI